MFLEWRCGRTKAILVITNNEGGYDESEYYDYTWDCIYSMRAAHISVTQAIFYDGEHYCRCIRPEFSDLQYNGIRPGHWVDVGQQLWGNVGVIRAGKYKCTLNLFVEEECSKDLNAIMANMGAEDKLDFSRACDEVFGNG